MEFAMNTATMLAATAVFGFTWGYQPLDERSTEYLIQLRAHELTVLADGTMQITTDVPDAAQPIGRIRIIVGNEPLPREARAPRPLDSVPGDASSTQPAVAIDAMPQGSRSQFDRDPLTSQHITHDPIDPPARGRYGDDRYGRSPRYGARTPPPDGGPALVSPFGDQGGSGVLGGQPVPPAGTNSSVLDYREETPFASAAEQPDWRNLLEVPQVMLSPPPLERTSPSIPGFAAGPPQTTDPTYGFPSGTQPSIGASINQFGPALSPPGDSAAPFDQLTERPQRDANRLSDNPAAEVPSTAAEFGGFNPSPAGEAGVPPEKLTAAQQKVSSWRLWALALGSCAFGLLWCNVYQWGIYKSVRRRYLTLLRRTGEV